MAMILYAAEYSSVALIQCSPPSWMAHILLTEHRLEHEIRWLSFAKGDHKTPEMLARNARGTVPVLEHDGVCVSETLALLRYVDWQSGARSWMPQQSKGRARALTRFHESAAIKDAGMALLAYLMRNPQTADASEVLRLRDEVDRELDRWEAIEPGDGFGGEYPGLADLVVFCYLATLGRLGYSLDADSRLGSFYERFQEREAVRASWPKPWSSAPETRPLA